MKVTEYPENELSEEVAAAIVALTNSVWPSSGKTEAVLTRELLEKARRPDDSNESMKTRFAVWDGPRVVSHARTFIRTISFDGDHLDVLALANVCTDPEFRGRGLGKAVVARAFERLEELGLPVCLFQTGVVSFYEQFGGRQVDNRFVNRCHLSQPQSNPWWDDAVMIYPGEADWSEATIDLGGAGY